MNYNLFCLQVTYICLFGLYIAEIGKQIQLHQSGEIIYASTLLAPSFRFLATVSECELRMINMCIVNYNTEFNHTVNYNLPKVYILRSFILQLVSMVVVLHAKKRGERTNGFLFIHWLLQLVAAIIILRSRILSYKTVTLFFFCSDLNHYRIAGRRLRSVLLSDVMFVCGGCSAKRCSMRFCWCYAVWSTATGRGICVGALT